MKPWLWGRIKYDYRVTKLLWLAVDYGIVDSHVINYILTRWLRHGFTQFPNQRVFTKTIDNWADGGPDWLTVARHGNCGAGKVSSGISKRPARIDNLVQIKFLKQKEAKLGLQVIL
jgi:hypothetical protein